MSNYDQFGEHSRTQFSSRSGGREVWPWIKRTTVLLNNAGQIVAEIPEILDYEEIKARYADVSFVIYDLTISYKGQHYSNKRRPFLLRKKHNIELLHVRLNSAMALVYDL